MKKIYSYALILLVVSLFGTIVWGVFAAYQRPLGEPLAINQAPPAAPVVAAAQPEALPEVQPQAQPKQPQETCGQTGQMKLLVIGSDRSAGDAPYGADAVRLIQVDFSQKSVTVAAFSRDLEVKVDGLADKKLKRAPLGLAYHYKYTETSGTDQERAVASTNLVAQLLYDNYKLEPDHYITTELQHFDSLVEAVGGVRINNPNDFVSDYGVNFPKGELSLTGEQAAEYMRTFKPGGDMARLQRQNLVMKGLREKLVDPGTLLEIPKLYENINDIVFTSLSVEQLNSLNCMLKEVPKEDILTYEIGPDERVTGPDGKLIEPPKALQAILNDLFKN
jgi:polyisoprenyl-teichoic acid--peptidoglycan teichoic acid transferase